MAASKPKPPEINMHTPLPPVKKYAHIIDNHEPLKSTWIFVNMLYHDLEFLVNSPPKQIYAHRKRIAPFLILGLRYIEDYCIKKAQAIQPDILEFEIGRMAAKSQDARRWFKLACKATKHLLMVCQLFPAFLV